MLAYCGFTWAAVLSVTAIKYQRQGYLEKKPSPMGKEECHQGDGEEHEGIPGAEAGDFTPVGTISWPGNSNFLPTIAFL